MSGRLFQNEWPPFPSTIFCIPRNTTMPYPPSAESRNATLSSTAYFAMWQAGELPLEEALGTMLDDSELLSDTICELHHQHALLLTQIRQMIEHAGGSVMLPGRGILIMHSRSQEQHIAP
jgi:hypothetical protein